MPESNSSTQESSSESTSSTDSIAQSLQQALHDDEEGQDTAVPLGLYWDEWARCVGSGYQWDSMYRFGKLDSCGKQWKDLKLAAEARLIQWRKPEKAKQLIESTFYIKRTTISPTAGAIWELKEKPGWN